MERNLWIERVIRDFQVWAGTCWELKQSDRRTALDHFRTTLPEPPGILERHVLNGLVFSAQQWCEREERAPSGEADDDSRRLVSRALAVVEARAPQRMKVSELARAVAVHPRTLNRAFHGMLRRSVHSELRRRQGEVAATLVAGTKVEAAAKLMGISLSSVYRLGRSGSRA